MSEHSSPLIIENRDILATCWTWAGDAAPARGDETSPETIADRLSAVADAGWQGIGLVHADLAKVRDSIGLDQLARLIADNGITTVELEFISNWWTSGALREESDRVRRELFDAAAVLGVRTIKIGAELQSFGVENPVALEDFQTAFDAIATDAGRHGLRVAMEPMPMSNITTIAEGCRLVTEVGNPHGGLVVDTWHVARAGTPYAELPALLPIEHVFVVELDDAAAEVQGTLWDDTIDHRLLPGEGDLDTAAFIAALHQAGWRGHWGVEIISETHRTKPLRQAVTDAADKTRAALDAAELLLAR
jgi:sugar phosphate isomerase/epimerase